MSDQRPGHVLLILSLQPPHRRCSARGPRGGKLVKSPRPQRRAVRDSNWALNSMSGDVRMRRCCAAIASPPLGECAGHGGALKLDREELVALPLAMRVARVDERAVAGSAVGGCCSQRSLEVGDVSIHRLQLRTRAPLRVRRASGPTVHGAATSSVLCGGRIGEGRRQLARQDADGLPGVEGAVQDEDGRRRVCICVLCKVAPPAIGRSKRGRAGPACSRGAVRELVDVPHLRLIDTLAVQISVLKEHSRHRCHLVSA
eukprot:4725135-Prymnesium_polylepis.1